MKFSKNEILKIKQALFISIDSENDFIEAHRTELKFINGNVVSVIPKEHKNIVKVTNRNIKSFQKILSKIERKI